MKRLFFTVISVVSLALCSDAQIGYQVTVFDQVKMEPKANQEVTATVTITDNAGTQIASQTYTGTTDEFGILSMTVGNADTFDKTKWDNLPLWISASVDGITLSKTQILNVPVAEYAKRTGSLTVDILCSKTWRYIYNSGSDTETYTLSFRKDGTGIYKFVDSLGGVFTYSFIYSIDGNTVVWGNDSRGGNAFYIPQSGKLCFDDDSHGVMN